jgi:hypothetical protein
MASASPVARERSALDVHPAAAGDPATASDLVALVTPSKVRRAPTSRWRIRCSARRFLRPPLNLGMMGTWRSCSQHGDPEADLLLAFGMRFDDCATGNRGPCLNAEKIIDIDPPINKNVRSTSVWSAISRTLIARAQIENCDKSEWNTYVNGLKDVPRSARPELAG